MVFHWSASDCKSPQISRTLLSIEADLNNAAVLMVSIHPRYPTLLVLSNLLNTILKTPITISITITLTFYNFFWFSNEIKILFSQFSFSSIIIPCFAGTSNYTMRPCYFLSIVSRSGLFVGIRWSVFISMSQIILCISFSWTDFCFTCSIWLYWLYC